jgi:hypothetical protein
MNKRKFATITATILLFTVSSPNQSGEYKRRFITFLSAERKHYKEEQ